jgi:outer membrane cobalamin receptor
MGARAEDQNSLLVTGSRIAGDSDVGRLGNIRTEKDLRILGTVSTIDAFRTIPGISIAAPSGGAGRAFVSFRGGEPNFTPIFVDGVKVNDPNDTYGGGFELGLIPFHEIGSITVIPGALSPVYGSDALAGVISLETRAPDERQAAEGAASADTQGGWTLFGRVAAPLGAKTSVALSASKANGATQTDAEDLDLQSVSLRVRQHLSGEGVIDLVARAAELDAAAYSLASGGPMFSVAPSIEERNRKLAIIGLSSRLPFGEDCSVAVAASWLRSREAIDNPGISPGILDGTPPFTSGNVFTRIQTTLNGVCAVQPWLTLSAGGSYEHERGRSDSTFDFGFPVPASYRLTRKLPAAFFEARTTLGNAEVSGALRTDFLPARPAKVTYSVRGTYHLVPEQTAAFASYATGFHLPSFFAFGSPLVGNPALRPETGRSIEAGLRHGFGLGLVGEMRWFDQDYRDLIDFDADLFLNVNRTRVRVRGAEAVLSWRPQDAFSLDASVTRKNISAATPLFLRPRWSGGLTATWAPASDWSLSGRATYVGQRGDSSIPTGVRSLSPYVQTTAAVTWRPVDKLELTAAFDNLLQEKFQEMIGFPGLRRLARFTARAQF